MSWWTREDLLQQCRDKELSNYSKKNKRELLDMLYTKDELIQLCRTNGVSDYSKKRKEEIVELMLDKKNCTITAEREQPPSTKNSLTKMLDDRFDFSAGSHTVLDYGKENNGYIYVFMASERNNHIKVGKTIDYNGRWKQYHQHKDIPDILIYCYNFGRDNYTDVETQMKRLLKPWNLHGEWYCVNRKLCSALFKAKGIEIFEVLNYFVATEKLHESCCDHCE